MATYSQPNYIVHVYYKYIYIYTYIQHMVCICWYGGLKLDFFDSKPLSSPSNHTSLCKRTLDKTNLVVFWIAMIDWNFVLYVICPRKKGGKGGLKGEENYQMHMVHLHGLKIYLNFLLNLKFFMNIVTIKWLWNYKKNFYLL